MFKLLLKTNEDLALLILRVLLAIVIFPHGAQKVLGIWGGEGFSAMLDTFTNKMGIPAPLAILDMITEFVGPIALVLGLLTRIAALGIGIMITVAALTVHVQNGFFMNWAGTQKGEGFEYHILVLAIALALVLQGGGRGSIDGWIYRNRAKEGPEPEA